MEKMVESRSSKTNRIRASCNESLPRDNMASGNAFAKSSKGNPTTATITKNKISYPMERYSNPNKCIMEPPMIAITATIPIIIPIVIKKPHAEAKICFIFFILPESP